MRSKHSHQREETVIQRCFALFHDVLVDIERFDVHLNGLGVGQGTPSTLGNINPRGFSQSTPYW